VPQERHQPRDRRGTGEDPRANADAEDIRPSTLAVQSALYNETVMTRRFTIRKRDIGKPLSLTEMARKYGLRARDAADVLAFVTSAANGHRPSRGEPAIGRKAGARSLARKRRSKPSSRVKAHEGRRQTR